MTNPSFLHGFRLALLLATLFLPASGCQKKSAVSSDQPNPKLEAIRKAGFPVTLVELNKWYAEPPPNENAATKFIEAISSLVADDANSPQLPLVGRGKLPAPSATLPVAMKKAIADFVAANQRSLQLLHEGAALTKARYPVDLTAGQNRTLPHLSGFKQCAQLLVLEAVLHAEKGAMDQAVDSIVAVLRLSRSLEDEPIMISQMVRIAGEAFARTGVERVLNKKPLTDNQLAKLASAYREAENSAGLTRALAGDRAMGIHFFQMSPEELNKFMKIGGSGAQKKDAAPALNSPNRQADFNFYLEMMEGLIAASQMPFPGSTEAAEKLMSGRDEARSRKFVLSAMLLPALNNANLKQAESVARVRVTQAALAVERYRLANSSKLPASLDVLKPTFLAAVPTDPFDGQPLRYKKRAGTGYVVYSVGKDRQDDGGIERKPGATSDANYDLPITISR